MIKDEIIENLFDCEYKAYLKCCGKKGTRSEWTGFEKEYLESHKKDFLASIANEAIIPNLDEITKHGLGKKKYLIAPSWKTEQVNISFDLCEVSLVTGKTIDIIPITILATERVSRSDRLILIIKSLLCQDLLKCKISHCKIYYGNNFRSSKISIENFKREAYKKIKQLSSLRDNEPLLCKNKHCPLCEFHHICIPRLEERDDLSLLGGIDKKNIARFHRRGLFSIKQLSYIFRPRKNKKAKNRRKRYQPELKALAIRDHLIYVWERPQLPKSQHQVFIDFEGLPDRDFIYLIGVAVHEKSGSSFKYFWASSEAEETAIFESFFSYLFKLKEFVIYHFGEYEIKAFKRLDKKTKGKFKKEIQHVLGRCINILPLFQYSVYLPTQTNSLKDIGNFLNFSWSIMEVTGLTSIYWRKKWENTKDDTWKKQLIQYNQDDCYALETVVNWLNSLKLEMKEVKEVGTLKTNNAYNWRNPDDYFTKECKAISGFAYFDYQQTKIFVRTNPISRQALRNKNKLKKQIKNISNEQADIQPKYCPVCKSRNPKHFQKQSSTSRKQVIDLKFLKNGVKKWVYEYQGGCFRCLKCNKEFYTKNAHHLKDHGDNLKKWCVNQHIEYYMSFKAIADSLREFNIKIDKIRAFRFKEEFANKYSKTYEKVIQHVCEGRLIHIDETSVNIKGMSSTYVWIFATMDAVFYVYRPNRETEFLREMLKKFNGVLVSDFYTGYDFLQCEKQKCLVHLLRDLNNDLYKNQMDIEFKNIVTNFGKLLKTVIETIDRYGLRKRNLNKHKRDVKSFFNKLIFNQEYESDLAAKYQKRFMKNEDSLFTFLNHDNVPWNNNNAEHAVKSFAKHRERGNSVFTEKSIQDYMVLLSIQQTCKYRGIRFMDFLKSDNILQL